MSNRGGSVVRPADPRETITPESFTVAPQLLGKPLARPARRGAAIAIDLLFVAILVALGGRFLFFVATGWFLFRFAGRSQQSGFFRRAMRLSLLLLGLLLLYFAGRAAWNALSGRLTGPPSAQTSASPTPGSTAMEGMAVLGEAIALRRVTSESEAQELADRMAERLHAQGLTPAQIHGVILEAASAESRPWAVAVADRAVHAMSEPRPDEATEMSEDSLVLAYAGALESQDSARLASLRPQLAEVFAEQQRSGLERRVTRLERTNRLLEGELEEARREWGIVRVLRTFAEDLGLGFGWLGLYFTAFTALWHGQTPGKRLLQIQVLRLDGKPMGWWMSFERFGGYAAGFATGLLGFLQVFWDRNRQGIHDKITETVVVRL